MYTNRVAPYSEMVTPNGADLILKINSNNDFFCVSQVSIWLCYIEYDSDCSMFIIVIDVKT